MRVLQLIDSLEAGGAERVAVNIANALSIKENFESYLCTTRKEGLLKDSLDTKVDYLFLNKKSTFDFSAVNRLKKYIKNNEVDIIHAHSTSFFTATLVKRLYPKVKIVWHDHYGNSEFLDKRKFRVIKICSNYFSHIICVNDVLKKWALKNLKAAQVAYLQNFATIDNESPATTLKGEEGKRILHLANLRPQKDHITLLKAFSKVITKYPEHSLHCVGKNFEDEHAEQIFQYVKELKLNDNVFFYGSKKDISNILNQSDICVLSSKSEGLPIALLEYGLAGKPTIVTNVGNSSEVIENGVNGLIVKKENIDSLSNGLIYLIENKNDVEKYGKALKNKVSKGFSEDSYIKNLTTIYNSVLNE